MIVKGASRSGPRQLAEYLMRVGHWDTGEPAELIELQSPWAANLNGDRYHDAELVIEAFRDFQTLVEGTKQGRDGLYRTEISPAPEYAQDMTVAQWKRCADILGEELGLQGQPRASFRHGGTDGRTHFHVVWCRTDIDAMKVISDAQNYLAHERASMRMELEFGHEFVPGKHAKRDREKQPEFPRAEFDQAEAQQAERQGVDPKERKAAITGLRQSCDDGQAFRNALEEAGYILARGDRRDFMLVDQDGEAISLSRQVTDLKGKEFKAFMADIDPATLPTVDQAKDLQAQRALAIEDKKREEVEKQPVQAPQPEPAPAPPKVEQPTPAPVDEELEALKKAIADRQAQEARKWADFHAQELRQLDYELSFEKREKLIIRDTTDNNQMDALKERLTEERKGWQALVDALQARWNPEQAAEKTRERRKQIADLQRRQERERKAYATLIKYRITLLSPGTARQPWRQQDVSF